LRAGHRVLVLQNQNQRHSAAVSAQSVAAFLASAMQEHALAVGCNEAIRKMWLQPCNGGEQHTETKIQIQNNEESRAQAGNYQSSDEEHDRRRMMAAGSSSSAHASAATGTGNSHPHTVVINF